MTKRFELTEVAAEHLPDAIKDGPRWLRRQLNAGRLKGRRYGRHWTMTQADVDYMLDAVANETITFETKSTEPRPVSFDEALSPRSRRRLRAVD